MTWQLIRCLRKKWEANFLCHSKIRLSLQIFTYPSILYQYLACSLQGLEPIPVILGWRWSTPQTTHHFITGLTGRDTVALELPINWTCMPLDCGRSLHYPERTCINHRERPGSELNPGFKSDLSFLIHFRRDPLWPSSWQQQSPPKLKLAQLFDYNSLCCLVLPLSVRIPMRTQWTT